MFVKQWRSLFVFFQGHPEYGLDSLLREYRRDIGRYLRGENRACPPIPQGYFDEPGEEALAAFTAQALEAPAPELLASFPERLQPRADVAAGWRAPAVSMFRNWLSYLAERKV
jgi:homoserine O-succinyltransferase